MTESKGKAELRASEGAQLVFHDRTSLTIVTTSSTTRPHSDDGRSQDPSRRASTTDTSRSS